MRKLHVIETDDLFSFVTMRGKQLLSSFELFSEVSTRTESARE